MDAVNFWLALAAAVLSGASIVLHVIAPRTKTTVDDRLVAKLDELLGLLRPPAVKPADPAKFTSHIGTLGLLALVVLGLAAASSSACTPAQRTSAGHAVVDCTAANGATIGQLAISMRGDCAAGPGTDWACVRSRAISAGLVIGGCAFLQLVSAEPAVARVASATGEPPPERPGRAAFESYRASVAGGAAFRTAAGER